MTNNKFILQRLALGEKYMGLLDETGYTLVDMNMIEPFSMDDKYHHPTSVVFERNNAMYAIRSDWTRTLLNFNSNFYSDDTRFGYFGPVVRENESFYQAGVEIYKAGEEDIINALLMHMNFVEECAKTSIKTLVINNDQLIDLFIEKYNLPDTMRQLIYTKNISELRELLGKNHDLYKIMSAKVSDQFKMVSSIFGDTEVMQAIAHLKEKMDEEETKFILDLSFRSPQNYYNGLYFQAFLNSNSAILSGGEYNSNAFGIALNLTDGGIL